MDLPEVASRSSDHTAVEDENRGDMQLIDRRIRRLSLHLNPALFPDFPDRGLEMVMCAGKAKVLKVRTELLLQYMKGRYRDIQDKVYAYLNSRPDLQTPIEISKDEHRELCMRQLRGLVHEAGIRPFKYVVEDPAKYFAIAEAAGSIDMSLGIKLGVQYR